MASFPLDRLAEVFATLAPMTEAEARRRADMALETLLATRSTRDLLELGLALRALDAAPLNALGGAGLTSFGRATQPQRERILLSWANSRIPQRRTAFQALKRIGLFLAYADPGPAPEAPSNSTWDAIGYAPRAPATDAVAPAVMPMAVERSGQEPLRLEADVVVVGSGAGGGVMAARLAAAGRSVLLVEAAPHRAEPDLPRLEAEAWRDLYLDRGTTGPRDLSVTILAGAAVGGGTTVNWTTSIAAPTTVRDEWMTDHGLDELAGPPLDEAFERLEAELDLQPPSVVPRKDQLILDGAAALGWEAGVTRRNAGPCDRCGSCGFGCPWGAKRSGLRTHLARATSDGARLLDGARVSRVLHRGRAVVGVAGLLAPSGRPFTVAAPQVVLAAGALRTPVILASSGIGHRGVGRNLRLHPVVVTAALMPEPVDMWIGPTQAARSLEFIRPGPASADGIGPAHGGFIIESAPAHPGLAAAALPWQGRVAGAGLLSRLRHLAPLIGIVRDRGAGTVRPLAAGRARIDYRLDPADADTARRALVEMARLAHAGGASELLTITQGGVWWRAGEDLGAYLRRVAEVDTGPNRIVLMSAHQMGTAGAGADPRRAPVDPSGRVRLDERGTLLRGAYVADASLFPAALGVNPMLTVMALADRVAATVLADRAIT